MKINGRHYQTIWLDEADPSVVHTFDQRRFPHEVVIEDLRTLEDCVAAIRDMHVRGAPLIGVTAGYGLYLALLQAPDAETAHEHLLLWTAQLKSARPTAVDLFFAVDRMVAALAPGQSLTQMQEAAKWEAGVLAQESVAQCRRIGEYGLPLIEAIHSQHPGRPVRILTHCNAGWLACVDYGTALAPVYLAQDKGIPVQVWVDETRPRNQGAQLTAFELLQHGIPHTIITDNAGGHLMQHGMVDIVIVGTDRTTRTGDVANKIGTYLKALAAFDNGVPFYVALPSSTIDWQLRDGLHEIPIEQRGDDEVKYVQGLHEGRIKQVLIAPAGSPAANYGFDVTPARLVTGLITDRGICPASEEGLLQLYPEKRHA